MSVNYLKLGKKYSFVKNIYLYNLHKMCKNKIYQHDINQNKASLLEILMKITIFFFLLRNKMVERCIFMFFSSTIMKQL